MLFMVIERFRDNDMIPIYQRLRDEGGGGSEGSGGSRERGGSRGRQLPEGLKYIESWVEPNFSRCFQLMECDDLRLFQEWVLAWRGFGTTFEIVPVVTSAMTREVVDPHLKTSGMSARKDAGTMSG